MRHVLPSCCCIQISVRTLGNYDRRGLFFCRLTRLHGHPVFLTTSGTRQITRLCISYWTDSLGDIIHCVKNPPLLIGSVGFETILQSPQHYVH